MKKIFCGLLPWDGVPKFTKKAPASFIINSQRAGSVEGHWILIHKKENGTLFYFDPLGQPPKTYSNKWMGWMKKNSSKIIKNNRAVQPARSILCGCYCLYALFHLSRNVSSLKSLMKKFSSVGFHNDAMITSFMWKQFRFDVESQITLPPNSQRLKDFMLLLNKDFV